MTRGKGNHNSFFGGEKRITCRNRRCQKKIIVKVGNKDNGDNRTMKCPWCRFNNVFRIKTPSPAI